MPLFIVATPIGNSQDITLRGLEVLKTADLIILEEFKESTSFLRAQNISGKKLEQLNEHTNEEQKKKLAELCKTQNVALITDCGTPGFADPGADLIKLCRKDKTAVHSLPGPSSLMTLLSLSSEKIHQFIFRGFLSAENIERKSQWLELKLEKRAIVLMDTPYRLQKTLQELKEHFPQRRVLLTLNLTQNEELILEGLISEILKHSLPSKAEFMVLIYSL